MHEKRPGQEYYTNRHSCFLLTYHMVLVTKFRNPVLTGAVKDYVYTTIKSIMTDHNCNLLDINGEPDHIHLLFEAGPEEQLLGLVNVLKTKTARMTRKRYPDEIGKHYWKPYFWSQSYFVTTVGNNSKAVVADYIKNQKG